MADGFARGPRLGRDGVRPWLPHLDEKGELPPELQELARAGMLSAAATLLADSFIGFAGEVTPVPWAVPAVTQLSFTPPSSAGVSEPFELVVNNEELPMKVALQLLSPQSPITPYLWIAHDDALLSVFAGQGNTPECRNAAERLAAGVVFHTTLWPHDKLMGRVTGPVASQGGNIIVRKMGLRHALEVLRRGNAR